MLRMKRNESWLFFAVAAALTILSSGCGSSSSRPSSMSQAQALAVTQQVSNALDNALQVVFVAPAAAASGAHRSLATVIREMRPDASSPCTPTSTGENCSWPVSYTGPCPGGGAIAVTGEVEGSLNSMGGGSVQTQILIAPANCAVSNLVINGDPGLLVDNQITFTQTGPAYPITLTEIGGVSYGPKPSGSCQFNVTYTVSSENGCTVSGTACGQTVGGSCQ